MWGGPHRAALEPKSRFRLQSFGPNEVWESLRLRPARWTAPAIVGRRSIPPQHESTSLNMSATAGAEA